MAWGTFGTAHILSLIFAIALNVALYFLLKCCTQKIQIIVLGILSFSGIAAIIYNLVTWNSPLEYLPFHLCSINALILPFAVFTRNKVVANLTLLWSLGAAGDVIQVNYMYSITPDNPVLVLFHNLIPHSFWYMLPALLIAVIYLGAIYGTAAVLKKKT